MFADDAHVQVEATRGIYQTIVTACRNPDRQVGKTTLATVIAVLSHDVLPVLTDLITLRRRAGDVLAYFDRPGTALGFRNLTNYILRSLLDTGGFRDRLHPHLR